jgi:hypothetical protein
MRNQAATKILPTPASVSTASCASAIRSSGKVAPISAGGDAPASAAARAGAAQHAHRGDAFQALVDEAELQARKSDP